VLSATFTFYFSSLGRVNSGIIATTFSLSVIFVTLFFRVKYAQYLTKVEVLGCLFICMGVGCVGFGSHLS